jgi:hypothetical protein
VEAPAAKAALSHAPGALDGALGGPIRRIHSKYGPFRMGKAEPFQRRRPVKLDFRWLRGMICDSRKQLKFVFGSVALYACSFDLARAHQSHLRNFDLVP